MEKVSNYQINEYVMDVTNDLPHSKLFDKIEDLKQEYRPKLLKFIRKCCEVIGGDEIDLDFDHFYKIFIEGDKITLKMGSMDKYQRGIFEIEKLSVDNLMVICDVLWDKYEELHDHFGGLKTNLVKKTNESMNNIKDFKQFESMIHQRSIDQMKKVSDIMGNINIGDRVDKSSFANAYKDTKRDVFKSKIQSFEDYLKEPFEVNQNVKPWKKRKKKSKSK